MFTLVKNCFHGNEIIIKFQGIVRAKRSYENLYVAVCKSIIERNNNELHNF
jgi:hypothetical protein